MGSAISHHAVGGASRPATLDDAATYYADIDPAMAEATIDAFVADAIAAWRLEDATYWQRVKFRARLMRTMRRTEAFAPPLEAISLPTDAKTTGDDR